MVPSRQKGATLLLFMVIVVTGVLAVLGSRLIPPPVVAREKQAMPALLAAKNALIGYAMVYRETHRSNDGRYKKVAGFLPCPDRSNNGSAQSPCGGKGKAYIGRFPYKTLLLPDLRDESGACLWYAVAGDFKNSPAADRLNPTVRGNINVQDQSYGFSYTDADQDGAVAVIFAPGETIKQQVRSAGQHTCDGEGSLDDLEAWLDFNHYAAFSDNPTVLQNRRNGVEANDRIVWIRASELFSAIRRRQDFAELVDGFIEHAAELLTVAYQNNASILPDGDISAANQAVHWGYFPYTQDALKTEILGDYEGFYKYWHNLLVYGVCRDYTPCLQTVIDDQSYLCTGALVFLGADGPKALAESELEHWLDQADNRDSITRTGTKLHGRSQLDSTAYSAEVIKCLS